MKGRETKRQRSSPKKVLPVVRPISLFNAQVEIPLAVGGGSVPVVLPGVANVAGNPPGAQLGRGKTWRRGAEWGSVRRGGRLLAGVGEGM